MKCPYCLHPSTRVIDKRNSKDFSIRRRRECLKCKKRFTTYENIRILNLIVIKRDKIKKKFDRNKLRLGILKACEKRPIKNEKIENVLDYIEAELRKRKSIEVSSRLIGELVMESLKKLDKVAYIRFASVYRKFRYAGEFKKEVEKIC